MRCWRFLFGFLALFLMAKLLESKEVAVQRFDKKNHKIFELLADKVSAKDDVVSAEGNAVLLNYDVYILADKVRYNTKTKEAMLEGNIKVYKGEGLLVKTDYVKLNLNDKYEIIFPFYIQDSVSGIWVSADIASGRDQTYKIRKMSASGCSIDNPIWHVDATSGSYNMKKSHLSMWNPKIYIGDIPILYLPYIFMSTSNKRTTGFLYPEFGTSNLAGFIYLQPFYLAPKDSWDMTFTPQIRSKRGFGLNFEARYINSKDDRFLFHARYFRNYTKYVKEYDLRNQNIFGFEFLSSSRNTLQKYFHLNSTIDNGHYIDFLYMNDLDYVRFEKVNKRITDATHMSRANYYLQTENHYYGLNIKYFLNLNKINNNSTFQSVPNLQYHKYLNHLYFKNLLYSVDYQFKNTMREIGYGYVQNALYIPVGLQFSLFKKYLSLGVWNNIELSNVALMQTKDTYVPSVPNASREFGNFFSSGYSIYLNTDLAREYNKVFHSIQFEAMFNMPYYTFKDGLFDKNMYALSAQALNSYTSPTLSNYAYDGRLYDSVWNPTSILPNVANNKTLNLNLTQYLYGLGGQELLYWKISQRINIDDKVSMFKAPLESKIGFSPLKGLNIFGNVFYSFYKNRLEEISINANYQRKFLTFNLSYYLKNNYNDSGISKFVENSANYLKAGFSNDFGYFSLSADVGYDIRNNVVLNWNIGIFKKIRCFGIGFQFVNQRRPILTSNSEHPLRVMENNYVKLELDFSPLTKTNVTYRSLKRR